MADITFLATDADCELVWEIIFSELRLTAYPDPWFGSLPAPALKTRADVLANLAEYPRIAPGLSYFLISPEWSFEPLNYCLCDNNPNFPPHWCVGQRYGGPSIHFIPSFDYPRHKKSSQIISGMFSDYPYYYSALHDQQTIERPAGLVATMKTIKQRLLSNGETVRSSTGQRAIAMNHALAAHSAGVVLRTGDIIYSEVVSRRRTKR